MAAIAIINSSLVLCFILLLDKNKGKYTMQVIALLLCCYRLANQ
jgi:hypothetical protein